MTYLTIVDNFNFLSDGIFHSGESLRCKAANCPNSPSNILDSTLGAGEGELGDTSRVNHVEGTDGGRTSSRSFPLP